MNLSQKGSIGRSIYLWVCAPIHLFNSADDVNLIKQKGHVVPKCTLYLGVHFYYIIYYLGYSLSFVIIDRRRRRYHRHQYGKSFLFSFTQSFIDILGQLLSPVDSNLCDHTKMWWIYKFITKYSQVSIYGYRQFCGRIRQTFSYIYMINIYH